MNTNNITKSPTVMSEKPLHRGRGWGGSSTAMSVRPAHRIFEVEALNDIFCTTEEATREFLSAVGHLYAQKPQSTRIYSLVITAMELGFKLGFVRGRKR